MVRTVTAGWKVGAVVLSVRVRAVMLNLLEARRDLMRAAPRLPVAWRDVRDSFLGGVL